MTDSEIIALNTKDSYSFDRYGMENWIQCAQLLIDEDLSQEQAETFLRSKHMRWCADAAYAGGDDWVGSYQATRLDLDMYITRGINFGGKNLKGEAALLTGS